MAVLVTGSSGFLGVHIVRELVSRGEEVIGYSLEDPSPPALEVLGDGISRFRFVRGDLLDGGLIGETLDRFSVRRVIHAAAINGEPAARTDPGKAYAINVGGTAQLLSLAAGVGVERVIYVGSGTQYGPRHDLKPLKEDEPAAPLGVYATTKQMAEMLGIAYCVRAGINFVSVRVSTPYGPMERIQPGPVHIQFWCRAALEGRRVELPSGADHPRDFTFVGDVAAGLADLCRAEKIRYNLYNLSSGRMHTIGELVQIVRNLVPGSHISAGSGILPADHRTRTSFRGPLKIERLWRETGFEPKTELARGVAEYLQWLRTYPW